MSNMSYCRFHNTLADLSDCQNALERLISGEATEPLSREELIAARRLVETCLDVAGLIVDAADISIEDLFDRPERIGQYLGSVNAAVDEDEPEGSGE